MTNFLHHFGLAEMIPLIYQQAVYQVHHAAPLNPTSEVARAYELLLTKWDIQFPTGITRANSFATSAQGGSSNSLGSHGTMTSTGNNRTNLTIPPPPSSATRRTSPHATIRKIPSSGNTATLMTTTNTTTTNALSSVSSPTTSSSYHHNLVLQNIKNLSNMSSTTASFTALMGNNSQSAKVTRASWKPPLSSQPTIPGKVTQRLLLLCSHSQFQFHQ
jgi:hypothetical protein